MEVRTDRISKNGLRVTGYALLVVAIVATTSCATPETRLRSNPEVLARLPAAQLQDIKDGKVQPGFDMDHVRLALGQPDRVSIRTTGLDRTAHEVWIYRIYEDANGLPLYRGYFHRYYSKGDPRYPFYLDVPDRRPDGIIEVIFDGSNVLATRSADAPRAVSFTESPNQ